MYLIVGLGNPGEKYLKTRHNLGFEIVDKLVDRLQAGPLKGEGNSWEKSQKFKAEICQLQTSAYSLILVKPQTYMNNSGMAVAKLASYFKIPPENIVIVQDELDLSLGHLKIRLGGAAAGHHGVESIIKSLGTDKFIRLRLGIGNLKSQSSEHGGASFNVEHFVLEPFTSQEGSTVKRMIKQGVKALEILLEKGLDKAQNQFN